MLVVNLFAGSGAGKSTTAAGVFHALKRKDINCELVTEYAKDLVWDESYKVMLDQLLIFAQQNHRLRRLVGKVDVVITDSPLLLSIVYNKAYSYNHKFNDFIMDIFNRYDNMNYFLKRTKKYNPIGRLQTEEEAKEIDKKVKSLLDLYVAKYTLFNQKTMKNIGYTEIEYNVDTVDIITDDIIRRLSQ